jgi:hypothetical protein
MVDRAWKRFVDPVEDLGVPTNALGPEPQSIRGVPLSAIGVARGPLSNFSMHYANQCSAISRLFATAYTALELELGTEKTQQLAPELLPLIVGMAAAAADEIVKHIESECPPQP